MSIQIVNRFGTASAALSDGVAVASVDYVAIAFPPKPNARRITTITASLASTGGVVMSTDELNGFGRLFIVKKEIVAGTVVPFNPDLTPSTTNELGNLHSIVNLPMLFPFHQEYEPGALDIPPSESWSVILTQPVENGGTTPFTAVGSLTVLGYDLTSSDGLPQFRMR